MPRPMEALPVDTHIVWELGTPLVSDPVGYSKKKEILTMLKSVGAKGSSFVNAKTHAVVTRRCGKDEWEGSYALKKAVALGVPVVTEEYLKTWADNPAAQPDLSDYTIATPHGATQGLVPIEHEEPERWWEAIGDKPGQDAWPDPTHPSWTAWVEPSTLYTVVYRTVYARNKEEIVIELHAVCVTNASQAVAYKVLFCNETVSKVAVTDNVENAEKLFEYLHQLAEQENYSRSSSSCKNIGSKVGLSSAPLNTTVPNIQNQSLETVVDHMFKAGWTKVQQAGLNPHDIAHGMSLQDVEDAECLLATIAQKTEFDNQDLTAIPELSKYVSKLKGKVSITCTADISEQQDLLDILRDMLSVGEFVGGNIYDAGTSWQYASLSCQMDEVKEGRFKDIAAMIRRGTARDIEIESIFSLRKDAEVNNKEPITPSSLLLHASPAGNIPGILSRGLRLPKYQRKRRDKGMLGKGLYFTDSIDTALKYADSYNGYCYVLVCDVATGRVADTTQIMCDATEAPEGFDCVHGRKHHPGSPSSFVDDEYCVYRTTQQALSYLVRIKCDRKIPPPLPPRGKFVSENTEPFNVVPQDLTPLAPAIKDVKIGLVSDGVAVPLKATHVKGKLLDTIGEVVVMQHYRNASSYTIEAKYVFPLQGGAAVCGFEAFINDKHLVGITKEKEQAKREYTKAVAAGKGAYLLDESETPDVFTVSVGNLPPKSDVVIKITYVTELEVDAAQGCIRWVLPSKVHPASRMAALSEGPVVGGDSHVAFNPTGTDIEIGVAMPWDITKLVTSHEVLQKRSQQHATVKLAPGVDAGREDFVLEVFISDLTVPRMWVENDGSGTQAGMICFFPEFENHVVKSGMELLLAVDCSFSMQQGGAMNDAITAVHETLREIPQKTLFNVLPFGNNHAPVFPRSLPMTPSNLERALQAVSILAPCRGGTNVENLVSSVTALRKENVNIIMFTDGQLGSQLQSSIAIMRSQHHTRLFTVGVGSSMCTHTLRALAHAGNGMAEVLGPDAKSKWVSKLKKQIWRAGQGVMSQATVDWSGEVSPALKEAFDKTVVQAPQHIAGLYCGERSVVYSFCDKTPRRAEMKAIRTGPGVEPVGYADEIPEERFLVTPWPSHYVSGSIIHKLCARNVIRDWEDGMYHPNPVVNEQRKQAMKPHIVDIGIKYNLVTKFTSMLAVEERSEAEKTGSVANTTPGLAEVAGKEHVDVLPEQVFKSTQEILNEQEEERQLLRRLQTGFNNTETNEQTAASKKKRKTKRKKKLDSGEHEVQVHDKSESAAVTVSAVAGSIDKIFFGAKLIPNKKKKLAGLDNFDCSTLSKFCSTPLSRITAGPPPPPPPSVGPPRSSRRSGGGGGEPLPAPCRPSPAAPAPAPGGAPPCAPSNEIYASFGGPPPAPCPAPASSPVSEKIRQRVKQTNESRLERRRVSSSLVPSRDEDCDERERVSAPRGEKEKCMVTGTRRGGKGGRGGNRTIPMMQRLSSLKKRPKVEETLGFISGKAQVVCENETDSSSDSDSNDEDDDESEGSDEDADMFSGGWGDEEEEKCLLGIDENLNSKTARASSRGSAKARADENEGFCDYLDELVVEEKQESCSFQKESHRYEKNTCLNQLKAKRKKKIAREEPTIKQAGYSCKIGKRSKKASADVLLLDVTPLTISVGSSQPPAACCRSRTVVLSNVPAYYTLHHINDLTEVCGGYTSIDMSKVEQGSVTVGLEQTDSAEYLYRASNANLLSGITVANPSSTTSTIDGYQSLSSSVILLAVTYAREHNAQAETQQVSYAMAIVILNDLKKMYPEVQGIDKEIKKLEQVIRPPVTCTGFGSWVDTVEPYARKSHLYDKTGKLPTMHVWLKAFRPPPGYVSGQKGGEEFSVEDVYEGNTVSGVLSPNERAVKGDIDDSHTLVTTIPKVREVAGVSCESNMNLYSFPVVKRNTTVPTKKSIDVCTTEEFCDHVTLSFFAGESFYTKNNSLLANIRVDVAKKHIVVIHVEVETNFDDSMTISCSGDGVRSKKINVSESDLSQSEIDEMCKAAEREDPPVGVWPVKKAAELRSIVTYIEPLVPNPPRTAAESNLLSNVAMLRNTVFSSSVLPSLTVLNRLLTLLVHEASPYLPCPETTEFRDFFPWRIGSGCSNNPVVEEVD